MIHRVLVTIALVFATSIVPALAKRGLPEDAPVAAERRYQIATQLYNEHRHADAAREFRVAFELYPTSPKLAYNLARCLERAGESQQAIDAYRTYLKLAPKAADRVEVQGFVTALEDLAQKRLPELLLSSEPEGASVVIDGTAQSEKTPFRLRLAPGAHVIRFTLAQTHETRTVEVAAGRQNAVHVELQAEASPPPPTASGRGWMTWAGAGAAALGVGGVVLGFVEFGAAQDTIDESGELTVDDPGRGQLEDDLGTQQTLMWLGFGAGGALLATGVALILLDDGDDPVALAPTPGGLVLHVRF